MATYVHWKDISTSTGRMNTNFRRMAIWGKEKERNAEEVGGAVHWDSSCNLFFLKKEKKTKANLAKVSTFKIQVYAIFCSFGIFNN